MARLGKAITESYYGKKPEYSYWTGCSTGGRQGLMMAQRYPELYDGILALAPAINWNSMVPSLYWPQQVMNRLGVYPPQCELSAYTKAAVASCDELTDSKTASSQIRTPAHSTHSAKSDSLSTAMAKHASSPPRAPPWPKPHGQA